MPVPPTPLRRVDGSMSLLVDLMRNAEDPAYAAAAAARPAFPGRPRGHRGARRATAGAVVVALLGVLTGIAAASVRASADDSPGRTALVREVRTRTAQSDALAGQQDALNKDVTARRDAALSAQDGAAAAQLRQLELTAATSAVTGPGVVVVLDDRPAAAAGAPVPRGGQIGSGRVLDRDLQDAVNGLWAAGAEAVTVNGLRLTARTAIRSAGEAVLVDYRPLSPPYVIRAIGPPASLEPDFVDGRTGRDLAAYTSLYGLRFTVTQQRDLTLAAGTVPDPRDATPVPAGPS